MTATAFVKVQKRTAQSDTHTLRLLVYRALFMSTSFTIIGFILPVHEEEGDTLMITKYVNKLVIRLIDKVRERRL